MSGFSWKLSSKREPSLRIGLQYVADHLLTVAFDSHLRHYIEQDMGVAMSTILHLK